MSFLLLAKRPDGLLRLLSDEVSATRTDALSALSRLTADPAFDDWDSEVLVIDIEQGTPVLLVRPSAPEPEATPVVGTASEATSEESVRPAPAAPPVETDVDMELSEAEFPEIEVPELEPAEIASAEIASAEIEMSAVESAGSAADQPVEPEPLLEALVQALDDSAGVMVEDESAIQTALPASVESESVVSIDVDPSVLRDAIERTTTQMEESGVRAPESVVSLEEAPEEPEEISLDDPAMLDTTPEPLDANVLAEAIESVVAPSAETPAWPWDAVGAAQPVVEPSAYEEPGDDEDSLVRAAGDEETFATSRPVILGAYDEPDPEPPVGAESVAEPPTTVESEPEPAVKPEAQPVVAPEPFAPEPEMIAELHTPAPDIDVNGEPEVAVVESDFILDLDEATSGESEEKPGGYQAQDPDVQSMTCDDCIYVDTCPNKDQRDPRSCGSFQWR